MRSSYKHRYKALVISLGAYLLLVYGFLWGSTTRRNYADLDESSLQGQCFGGAKRSVDTITELTNDYKIIPTSWLTLSTKEPEPLELANLYEVNRQQDRLVMCQIGFDPFIVLSQLRANPDSIVYSFHSFEDEFEREKQLPLLEDFSSRFISIIGNPMQTIREFARQFGRETGVGLGGESINYLKSLNNDARDLFIDADKGFACDIVYVTVKSNNSFNYLLMSALLAHEDTIIVLANNQELTWNKAIENNVVRSLCIERSGTSYGHFVRPYATAAIVHEKPTYDAMDMVAEYLKSLNDALEEVTRGKTKTVVWIPVAYGHKGYADILYCSLKANGVTNYLFFSLDEQIHNYFESKGRNSFYSSLWYTQLSGGTHGWHTFKYNVAMRERYTLLLDVLNMGFDLLLNDADMHWVTNVLPDLDSEADLVAQLDTAGDGQWAQTCGGFILHKSRPGVKQFFSLAQQLAFFLPAKEDQEVSNILLTSKYACQRLPDYTRYTFHGIIPGDKACPSNEHLIEVELKDPRIYTGGQYYCKNHESWASEKVTPKIIHLNGANKPDCIKKSKDWGYELIGDCK